MMLFFYFKKCNFSCLDRKKVPIFDIFLIVWTPLGGLVSVYCRTKTDSITRTWSGLRHVNRNHGFCKTRSKLKEDGNVKILKIFNTEKFVNIGK